MRYTDVSGLFYLMICVSVFICQFSLVFSFKIVDWSFLPIARVVEGVVHFLKINIRRLEFLLIVQNFAYDREAISLRYFALDAGLVLSD